ncbi:MAG: sigma-70 family RNA polymerase sigma factor [Myxococcota bacterium]|nr:sigma-70 family RNA polymerase sigma factor [Myxococcota bacterium]
MIAYRPTLALVLSTPEDEPDRRPEGPEPDRAGPTRSGTYAIDGADDEVCEASTDVDTANGEDIRGSFGDVTEQEESDWLERARGGDAGAYGRLVRAHQRRVHATALQMLGDRGEAEDATQETFLRAWRALDRFDGRSKLSTWLYRICVNVCLNAIRRRKRRASSDLDDPRVPEPTADPTQGRTDPAAALETDQTERRLAAALESLSPTLRSAVVLVLLQGMPHKEAADVLGCPEGTVAWRIHEARRRLRLALDDLRDDAPSVAEGGRRS